MCTIGELDSTGHRHGCESRAWRYQLAVIDGFAQTLRGALPPESALMVVADHGMVDIDLERRVDIDAEPELRAGVSLIGGEARFRHLYCESGAVEAVVARWRDRLGSGAVVVSRDVSDRSRLVRCRRAQPSERGWAMCWSPAWAR